MKFQEKIGVLFRQPQKIIQYCQYTGSRLFHGDGIAKIPHGGQICTSSFSEYLSVYGLMPTVNEIAMIQKYLAHATEVFDLGANVGAWTVLMNTVNPQARVHSFEPNQNTYGLLEKNIKKNNCRNVLLNLAAVSDTEGQLTFQVPLNASIYGRVAPMVEGSDSEGRFANANSFQVPSIRLGKYCQEIGIDEIDFLKIDVEGHELAALKGLEPLVSQRKVKAIYMETIKENHDRMGTRFSELLDFISDCGYRFHTISENGSLESVVSIDQIKAHNHLCLPS